ncbi:hypothetical protein BKA64DRAFT_727045 [Cadophora sp. MPI-SDFR-AT-0126]|nr:hypothetical protein BKA64DRAFT_727045 [Leotiomycetes sp. MPI-SDFR-AT-0126]
MASSGKGYPTPPTPGTQSSDSVRQLSEFVIKRPPSCIEFVPKAGRKFANLLVVGTYQLEPDEVSAELTDAGSKLSSTTTGDPEPKTQYRNGSLSLLQFSQSTNQLEVLHTHECDSAIYDLHFLGPGQETFAAASSTGTINFYYVKELVLDDTFGNVHPIIIQPLWTAQVFSETTIITYFQFIPAHLPHHGPLISATTNDGGVYLMEYSLEEYTVDLLNDGKPITEHKLKYTNTPDYAWCCAVSSKVPSTIYSGGDGGDLIQDLVSFGRKEPYGYDSSEKLSRVHKFHDAGVTAILPLTDCHLGDEILLLTGSYDEFIRLYSAVDKKILAKLKLDGGVYRLKFLGQVHWSSPDSGTYAILACCMHAGTKVIHVKGSRTSNWSMEVVASLNVPGNDSGNYCYAAAARQSCPITPTNGHYVERRLCVSGTWLDKRLAVWELTHEFKRPEGDVSEGTQSIGVHVTTQGIFQSPQSIIDEIERPVL